MTEQSKPATSNLLEPRPGTVTACLPADRADLVDLYRAAYPQATVTDLAEDLRDENLDRWVVYRDERGQARVAVYVCPNGLLCVLAKPEECTSDEIRLGLFMLLQKAQEAFAPRGARAAWICHSVTLQPLAKILEFGGFLSKEVSVIRGLHFSDSGVLQRVN